MGGLDAEEGVGGGGLGEELEGRDGWDGNKCS